MRLATTRRGFSLIELIIVVVILSRAYEESSIKASRLKDSWENKREKMKDGKAVRSRRSTWIVLNEDTNKYELHPKKSPVVKRICELYLDGMGIMSIARKLNEESVETIGLGKQRAKSWGRSTVLKILRLSSHQ